MTNNTDIRKLKRAILKEELVALTGDYRQAIILNQLIYWTERVDDHDRFVQEEMQRAQMHGEEIQIELRHGWIYKKAEDLAEETMLGLSKSNMGTHIGRLVDKGWLHQRRNPKWKLDKTYQYRVDIVKVQRDLMEKGYSLEGYTLPNPIPSSEIELVSSEIELEVPKQNSKFRNRTAIPEITSKITTEITDTKIKDTHKKEALAGIQETVATMETENKNINNRVCKEIQNTLQQNGISVSQKTVQKWLSIAPADDILYAIQLAQQDNVQNPAAFIQGVLRTGVIRVQERAYQDPYQLFYSLVEAGTQKK